MPNKRVKVTAQEALDFHQFPTPGKLAVCATKPLVTARDLSLAYSPGVAEPCLAIQKDPSKAYDYTSKGNFVAVISNGTAVLGLGDLGALAGKPVMEGKCVLFKRFADVDSVDIEVNIPFVDENKKIIPDAVDKFVEAIAAIGETWGGINLEDIRSPECFEIEDRLKAKLGIPVFHDDQHGTAIITLAGLINACEITNRNLQDIKVVMNGSGAAGIACLELMLKGGVKQSNIILCDTNGPIYKGRTEGMSGPKTKYAAETSARTLAEAMKGADVFIGLSVKDVVTQEMVKGMAKSPMIFAMANPDPEIKPELVHEVRPDAIMATGRSDYPNQINNVMGFPFIFRGALDVRASSINDEMKLAAAYAIAKLAKEAVPSQVLRAYPGREMKYGPNYILPTPFDPRLITEVSAAVAQAAMESGVARIKITDLNAYKQKLQAHVNPSINAMHLVFRDLQQNKGSKKVIFAEGEEAEIIRTAITMSKNGYCSPILVGRESKILETCESALISREDLDGIQIVNAAVSKNNDKYVEFLFEKLKRNGYLHRDCERMVKTDRNIFASCMLANGDGNSLITGYTRGYRRSLTDIMKVIDVKKDDTLCGFSVIVSKKQTILIGDTSINENPSAQDLANIAKKIASKAALFGVDPRVAFVSYSNFGSRDGEGIQVIRDAIKILDAEKVKFQYDGEMTVNVALSDDPRKHYPFNRLSAPATILITNGITVANIAVNLIKEISTDTVVLGPILTGFSKPVQIMRIESGMETILNLAALSLAE